MLFSWLHNENFFINWACFSCQKQAYVRLKGKTKEKNHCIQKVTQVTTVHINLTKEHGNNQGKMRGKGDLPSFICCVLFLYVSSNRYIILESSPRNVDLEGTM